MNIYCLSINMLICEEIFLLVLILAATTLALAVVGQSLLLMQQL